ncbi:kinesin-like protein KIF25 [Apostichopus japonicus]|uniref:kinesin-like protein KIF25 n=1 Tax=Stichopus japonicus TaxID=307972 RepID=UPI003AB50B92
MPFTFDFVELNKVKNCDVLLGKKDEQITALKTENALLHLRLAQLEGQVKEERVQKDISEEELIVEVKRSHKVQLRGATIAGDVQDVKSSLSNLREEIANMPCLMREKMEPVLYAAKALDAKYSVKDSTFKELEESLQEHKEQLLETQERFLREKQRRKELHNTLVELRGNIRVYYRARPVLAFDDILQQTESVRRSNISVDEVVNTLDDETICIKCDRHGGTAQSKTFEFDRVFGQTDLQDDVFSDIKPLLTSLLDGYNVCMMAYGQTGSGKTYTMLGPEYTPSGTSPNKGLEGGIDDGIIPRAGRELFRLMREKSTSTYTVDVSVVEVYNNEICDLLTVDPAGMKHDVYTSDDGSMEVTSVSTKLIHSVEDLIHFVHHGLTHRHEDSTLVHDHSSRSHLVVTLTVTGIPTPTKMGTNRSGEEIVKTKLQLVDLAGSECVGVSGVKGTALREASFINRSLSALADVLSALAEQRPHIPYRNSRLTHLLQDSIGGDAKLLVICCVSPTRRFLSETLQCLGFGSRARQVQRGPVKRRPAIGGTPVGGGGSRSPVVTRTRRSHSLTSIHREQSLEVTTPNRLLYSEGNRFGYRGAPP